MGRDKSELPWTGQSFLEHAISRMQEVCDRVFVLGESTTATVPALEDTFAGDGPLAGLHTALVHSATDWNLLLAIDMPLVPARLLKFIVSRCETSKRAVVPRIAVGVSAESVQSDEGDTVPILQPLCAAYHIRLLPAVERALSQRELSIRRLLEHADQGMMGEEFRAIRVIDQHELSSAGFEADMLMNVNTPADFERAKRLAERLNVE